MGLMALDVVPPIDPAVAGPDIYSIAGRQAQDALSRDIAIQKAEHKLDIEDMWRRRIPEQTANNQRIASACERNPSLPGCPYTAPDSVYFVSTDPDVAKADIYSIEGKVARDGLQDMITRAKNSNLLDKYYAEVKAYEAAVEGDRRIVAACNLNPSLRGCPYTPPKRTVPVLGTDPTGSFADIYSVSSKQAKDSLDADLAAAKAERMADWQANQAQIQARQKAEAERIAIACKNNPSLPGCPY